MSIIIPNPIIVNPQPEKFADMVWINTININANNGASSPVTAYFSVSPFCSATGEILKDQMQHINVADVFAACANNPTLYTAMNSIYDAVEELCKQNLLFGMGPDPILPAITDQPVDVNINAGENAVFTVISAGRPLNYQWKKDGVDLTDINNVSGTNTPTLIITSSTLDDSGQYTVVISNVLGSVESNPATLSVN